MSETIDTTRPYLMNPLGAFSDRGTDYAKYRPTYPQAAIDTILKGLGNPSQLTAADIGAGTGIASQLLAERGVRVTAIEPNASMRNAAEPHPLIEFSDATAEQTHLPEAAVDLVISCQAFHWFNPEPTLAEFRRILKPCGRLALVWNDRAPKEQFFSEFNRLVRASMSQQLDGKHRGVVKPLLLSSPHFSRVRQYTFTHSQELDLTGTIGYALSKSFTPQAGAARQQLISDLTELHTRWADSRGLVSFVHFTTVYLAEPKRQVFSNFLKLISRWI